jgi:hypothetical protein
MFFMSSILEISSLTLDCKSSKPLYMLISSDDNHVFYKKIFEIFCIGNKSFRINVIYVMSIRID